MPDAHLTLRLADVTELSLAQQIDDAAYESARFAVVPASDWGTGIRATIEAQRAALPRPELRVAMRRLLEP